MSTATPSDVRDVIDTGLSDSDIQPYLDDATALIDATVDTALSTTEQTHLEKYLAALDIRLSKDRAISEDEIGDSAFTYDGSEIQWLRSKVSQWDPSGQLASTVVRDTNRHVASTTED